MDAATVYGVILVSIEILICLLGMLSNGLVALTILRNMLYLSSSSYFVLSIATSDFLSCAVAVPFAIANHFQGGWPFGLSGCHAYAFMIFLFALVSITHLAAIAAGKYLTITKSFSSESYFDKRQVLLIIVALWLYSFGLSVAPLVGWSSYGLEGTNATCSIEWNSNLKADKAYFGFVFFACYFLPITVISFCYYKIHKATKQVVANTSEIQRFAKNVSQALVRKQRKSAMYFLVIIVSFMVCWTPYAIVSFSSVLGISLSPVASSSSGVFAKISFFLNPILYALFSRKFRKRMFLVIRISKWKKAMKSRSIFSETVAL